LIYKASEKCRNEFISDSINWQNEVKNSPITYAVQGVRDLAIKFISDGVRGGFNEKGKSLIRTLRRGVPVGTGYK